MNLRLNGPDRISAVFEIDLTVPEFAKDFFPDCLTPGGGGCDGWLP